MSFRLDDVLYLEWAKAHSLLDCWNPAVDRILNGFRPILASVMWLLTHTAGTDHYWLWQLTLDASFFIALAYAGRTARYISSKGIALHTSILLYWLAFLPILNVLFWFSDMTFTIELMFVTMAWYYGIRGLLEARFVSFVVGLIFGTLGILTKEPAIVYVHVILFGTFVLRRHEILAAWKLRSSSERMFALLLYALSLGVSVWIYLASPARETRFVGMSGSSGSLMDFVFDRQEYYASIFLTVLPRLLIFAPIVYSSIRTLIAKWLTPRHTLAQSQYIALVLAVILLFIPISHTIFGISAILVVSLILACFAGTTSERRIATLVLPFGVAAVIALTALSITLMISKTQLTEVAILLIVIGGWGWSLLIGDLCSLLTPILARPRLKELVAGIGFVVFFGVAFAFLPKFGKQERLLRDVRDVRANVNDAIKWSAKYLPRNATLIVPDYGIYGISNSNVLNRGDDASKIEAQYVFHNGYVFIYLGVLSRPDIQHVYLEDSLTMAKQLDSVRTLPDGYLLIQSSRDYTRFHNTSTTPSLLTSRDSLMQQFTAGGFHSEIWRLR
jgi:hypothetical protein